jgi:hypothetical protein
MAVHSECGPRDRAAPHVRYADEAWPSAAMHPRHLPAHRQAPGSGAESRRRRRPSRLRVPLRERGRSRRPARGAHHLRRAGGRGDRAMGNKTEARARGDRRWGRGRAGHRGAARPRACRRRGRAKVAEGIGYPLLVKAVAGGGGKGMRVVAWPRSCVEALRTARSEAGSAFGDARVYLERHSSPAPHRVQLLGDHHGTVVPFVERECSIQRRHQKVIEESPSTRGHGPELRRAHGRRGRQGRPGRVVLERRHDRVPPRRGRSVLLPRDEHAAAGGAPDHGAGHRT